MQHARTATQEPAIYRTRFYADCAGVFEGGGCRAAAYAGAYSAAYRHGVRFSEVAGTSAGAIVAALIAAGADPDYLLNELRELDFRHFLCAPRNQFLNSRIAKWGGRIALHLPFDSAKIVVGALRGGLYSSEKIGDWVESRLLKLLNQNKGPVHFEDLVLPLYVVASDLMTMKARVWSKSETPTASVAHAVRASCSIPLFFQPVEEGSTLLVDGGLVSNLPLFVFAGGTSTDQFPDRRTLSFTLEADQSSEQPRDPVTYLRKLIGVAIDGGTDAQSRFQRSVAKVAIPTRDIQAVDFDRMNRSTVEMLIDSGSQTTTNFIRRELLAAQESIARAKSFPDEHQAYLRLTEQLTSARNSVIASFPDTKWFWELFPTAFYWLRHHIQIHCFTAPLNSSSADGAKEAQRRRVMEKMGVLLYEQNSLPFRGFIVDNGRDSTASALIFNENQFDYEPVAQYYDARTDITVLAALYDKVQPLLRTSSDREPLTMEAAPGSELLALLKKNVRQYRNSNVRIEVEEVPVRNIQLISRYVRAFRYRQIGTLIEAYGRKDLRLFQPAQIPLPGGIASPVTPPVFEIADDQYVALEGNTRSLYCMNNGIQTIEAVVVRGASEALPGIPVPLRQVRITSSRYRPDERIKGFNRELFRDIERAVRPLV